MEKTYQFLDIEINKPIYRKLSAVQYDNSSRYILVSVYSNFQPYDLTYATVKIYGIKKDKTVFFNNAKILDATNGKFEIDLTEQCLACDGDVEIQILILGLDKARLSSNSFILSVKKNIIAPVKVTSQDEWGMLTEGLANLAEYDVYKNNVNELLENTVRKSELVINPRDFGAICNGVNDDTQALINSLEKSRNVEVLDLLGGTCLITNIDITTNNLTIKNGTIILGYKGSSGLYEGLFGLKESSSSITFENINFLLHNDSKTLGRKGLVFLKCKNINFYNCSFEGFEYDTVRLDYCDNVYISNCKFKNCAINGDYGQISIFMSDNIIIEKNRFDNGGIGISLYGKSGEEFSKNIKILNNTISTNPTSKNGMGVYILKNVENINISGNFIENNPHENIVLTNISNPGEFLIRDVTISDNICKNAGYCDISLDKDVRNATVSNNVILSRSDKCSINISGDYLSVIGNIIERHTGNISGNSYGVHINNCSYAEVNSNTISGSTNIGIYNNQSHYVNINDNLLEVQSSCTGIGMYPKNVFEEHTTIIGNTIIGEDLKSKLIHRVNGDNARRYIITNNIFDTGTILLSYLNNSIVSHNIARNIDPNYNIHNHDNSQIIDNIGLDNDSKCIADPKPSYDAKGSERGRIVYIENTNDQLAFVQNNSGTYKYSRIGVAVGDIDNSTATDIDTLKNNFNTLLVKLRLSGILT
ncbi:BppU family phage baseplate upper protein [Paraclostridium bifermentans]|uniref:BppU family phage baseplate upper protein n=1 Tax=Paraclostridium bifermentans TaxID=1490 RepID=UPI001C7F0AD2|nr:BppU family phage baseplate upper protein [Paraclostridium bifermentans]GIM32973.1 hypothetical protein PAGU1678_22430 [Paraclostridium bifermentans subsp. muricolitidis]